MDARLKLLAAVTAIVVMVSEPAGNFIPFLFYGSTVLLLLVLSRIPPAFILWRLLLLAPFLLMAALFYPISHFLSGQDGGAAAYAIALSIFLKALFSVLVLLLLISTAKFSQLLAAMRKLGMPRIVGILSALMYRYIFIFWDESMRTNMARQSRTPGKLKMPKFKVYGNQMAMVFLRSWERSNMIYQAMLARGFTGDLYSFDNKSIRPIEAALTIVFTGFFVWVRV